MFLGENFSLFSYVTVVFGSYVYPEEGVFQTHAYV
jgi:hypothetical protein